MNLKDPNKKPSAEFYEKLQANQAWEQTKLEKK